MIENLKDWTNENSGFLGLILFVLTMLLGWASGIFRGLRSKPKLKLEIIEGPTFVCTFKRGSKFDDYPVHKTGISLYLKLTNVGTVPTDIGDVMVGYRCNYNAFTKGWWRYNVRRLWIRNPATALSEFGVDLPDGRRKVYPFLMQRSPLDGSYRRTYVRVGESQNGIVYFEEADSYGGHFPFQFFGKIYLKVRVKDSFARTYSKQFAVPMVSLEHAKVYYRDFGNTMESFAGLLPDEEPIDPRSLQRDS